MMEGKIKIITRIVFALLFIGYFNASLKAQCNSDSLVLWRQNDKGNVYVEAGAGMQMLFSSDADQLSFSQRVTPALSVGLGKWFTPIFGARLQISGYSLNGNSTYNGIYLADKLDNGSVYGKNDPVQGQVVIRPDGTYQHYLRYVNLHFDMQVRLMNWMDGINDARKYEIVPALGIGYFGTFSYKGTPSVNSLSVNASLMAKYYLTPKLDINVEASTVFLPDRFDGRITGRAVENVAALTVGATWHFGGRTFKPQVLYLKQSLQQYSTNVAVHDTVYVNKEVVVEKEIKSVREPFTLAAIAFGFAKTTPHSGQELQYLNLVSYLNANPDIKLRLDGYADKSTGTAQGNQQLSQERAQSLKNMLVATYKVDPKRIEVRGLGSVDQPYSKKKWNRVVTVNAIETTDQPTISQTAQLGQ